MKNKFIFVLLTLLLISINCIAQEYNCIMRYDTKGIICNNKFLCPLNGFTYGMVEYGYTKSGFYFVINHDNAVLGTNMMLLKAVDFDTYDDSRDKGTTYTLVQNGESVNARFWTHEDITYLSLSDKIEGKDFYLLYMLIPQDNTIDNE